MSRRPKPTLKDVAQHAGVAVSTISRFLNGRLELPGDTQGRIHTAIRELHYRPNVLARSLKAGRSRILGLVVPDLVNPFFAAVAEAASDQAYREAYSILLCATGNDSVREERYVSLLAAGQLDGLVYLGAHRTNPALEEIAQSLLPIVVVDEEVEGAPGGRLFVDNRRGGYLATEHLLHLGHRDIAFIGGEPGLLTTVERRRGYEDALLERGVEPDPGRTRLGEYTVAFGMAATGALLLGPVRPTAIFAASDILALGVLRAARQTGLSVPGDLSLVGFDDIPIAELLMPPLTTVRQPAEELGRAAVSMLVAGIGGEPMARRTFGVRLVARDSSRAPERSR